MTDTPRTDGKMLTLPECKDVDSATALYGLAAFARNLERELAEAKQLHKSGSSARAIVDEQAEDDGLWFEAATAPEAYLQAELRRLHAAVESEPHDSGPSDKGPWRVFSEVHSAGGRPVVTIQSDDFTHDVALTVTGDFESPEQKRAYAETLAAKLNGTEPPERGGDWEPVAKAIHNFIHSLDGVRFTAEQSNTHVRARWEMLDAIAVYHGYERPTRSTEPKCNPTLTECPRCKNDIQKCDGTFAAAQAARASEAAVQAVQNGEAKATHQPGTQETA